MKPKKKPLFFLAFILFSPLTICLSCQTKADQTTSEQTPAGQITAGSPVKEINSQEAKNILEQQPGTIILDVRTPQEYAAGHLKKALLFNLYAPDFTSQISRLDPAKTYLIYCAVGGRSKQATNILKQKGFKHIYDASQGFNALKAAGIPTE